MSENLYQLLGVDENASTEEIRRAYHKLSKRLHPDVAGPDAHALMKLINRAGDVLLDPQRRAEYDLALRPSPPPAPKPTAPPQQPTRRSQAHEHIGQPHRSHSAQPAPLRRTSRWRRAVAWAVATRFGRLTIALIVLTFVAQPLPGVTTPFPIPIIVAGLCVELLARLARSRGLADESVGFA